MQVGTRCGRGAERTPGAEVVTTRAPEARICFPDTTPPPTPIHFGAENCVFGSVVVGTNPDKTSTDLQDQRRQKRESLKMEKVYKENEGKPENEGKLESGGKPEDEVEPEDGDKSEEDEMPHIKRNPEHRKRQGEGQADGGGQAEDEGKQKQQGKAEDEGNPRGEGEPESQGQPESVLRAAEKRPAEDYVPRKAKRKTDRGTEDSPKDCQENLQERHAGSEEVMREGGDVSRAQEELRKKQKMGGFHWMQRDVQDPFAPRGQRGVRGVRGGGRGQKDLEDVPSLWVGVGVWVTPENTRGSLEALPIRTERQRPVQSLQRKWGGGGGPGTRSLERRGRGRGDRRLDRQGSGGSDRGFSAPACSGHHALPSDGQTCPGHTCLEDDD
ncbi:Transcription elongation factor A protein-like 5 [Galemys pyrenaicus]|uniref:Transcription elongation factor A protein-like 5 n=1 Tax=Galemys pyrenaicus TaxID=202257 RepID=A0A8J6DH50_GALPY|nr:Transcription elongation factor A protein-like 5 [Galemys pyrenaicus]